MGGFLTLESASFLLPLGATTGTGSFLGSLFLFYNKSFQAHE
jgi:hypothetical protein